MKKVEKIYAIFIVVLLVFFMASTVVNYLRTHDVSLGNFVNETLSWAEQYPFDQEDLPYTEEEQKTDSKIDNFVEFVRAMEQKVDDYTANMIFAKEELIEVGVKVNDLLNAPILVDKENASSVFKLENDYLAYIQPKLEDEDAKELAESLDYFFDYLNSQGIDCFYANMGSKINPTDKQTSAFYQTQEYTNENADLLESYLEEKGIDYIDFRNEMIKADLDWYDSYYKGDHHWKVGTGLWASKVMAEKLNTDYGFSFDLDKLDEANYIPVTKKNFTLGGQAREIVDYSYLEDFEYYIPKETTNFTVSVPSRNVNVTGPFKDALLDLDLISQIEDYSKTDHLTCEDAYNLAMVRNDAIGIIKNNKKTNNDGKKILLIQDSFLWYQTAFLATDVSEIRTMFLPEFTGSVKKYIEEYQPDIVIVAYCEKNIRKIDWSTHNSYFDFR